MTDTTNSPLEGNVLFYKNPEPLDPGLHGALGYLNRRTSFCCTAIYRLDGQMMRNIFLYDRLGSYDLVWWLGVGMGIFAAIVHWPIQERPAPRPAMA